MAIIWQLSSFILLDIVELGVTTAELDNLYMKIIFILFKLFDVPNAPIRCSIHPLGKFQDFLRSCNSTFYMIESQGVSENVICLTVPDNDSIPHSNTYEPTQWSPSDLRRNAIQAITGTLQAQEDHACHKSHSQLHHL